MLAFLIGHLFYVAAYLNADRAARWARAVPLVLWGAGVIYLLRAGLSAAGMLIPVSIYTAVICTMMWRAVARIRPGVGGRRWLGGDRRPILRRVGHPDRRDSIRSRRPRRTLLDHHPLLAGPMGHRPIHSQALVNPMVLDL